ncbi:SDR family oxidoreductase [Heyndrickxia oleronia]
MLFLSKLSLSHLSGTSVTIFFILDHSPPNKLQSKKLQEEIQNNGGQANYKVADVTSHEQMEELADALKKLGKIDVLVNNAGLMHQAFL